MSRRKDVHIPKVWEAEEISDDDDEDIEQMQKAVEDILSKITKKKKTTQVSQKTPVQFDIKIEVEEFDEQPSTSRQSHKKKPKGSNSQNHGTTNTTKQNNQNINKIQTTEKQPQQSLLIQKSSGSQNPQLPNSKDKLCQKSISPSPQPNTYRNKNNPTNSQSTEQNKSTNQHFVLETHNIKSTMQILSKFGNVADNYIYILMKNYENIPTVPDSSHIQMALQKVLEVWNTWFLKDPINRGAPLLYKCKDCGWAWWHLNSFLEHIRNVHEREKWKLRFEFEATNGESYVALKISNKLDKSLPAVRIVNAPCWRCGMLPGDKYQNFNTTSLTYHCKCGLQFAMCHDYRLHLDVCPTTTPMVKKLVNYKCYLCFLRFDTPEELQRHRLLSHTVRSDLPASWTPIKKCIYCCMAHFDGISDCPAMKRMVPCGFCTKTFSTTTVMNLHQSFSQENYKCRLCDEILKRECMEMLHLVKHTNNYVVLLKCMICNSSNTFFDNDTTYNIHLLSKHPSSDQPAMKVPVPLKCLQDSGYNVKTLETDKVVVPPPMSHTYYTPVTIQGNKSEFKRKAGQKQSPRKRVRQTKNSSPENKVNTMEVSKIKVEEDIEDFINTEMEINEMILLNNKDSEALKIRSEDFEEGLSEGNKLNDPNNESNSNINSNKNNPNTVNGLKDNSFQPFDNEINKIEGCDKVFEIKKENTEDDVLKKGEEFTIAGTQNGLEINSNKNKPTACNSSKKENCDISKISLTNNDDKVIKNNNDKLNATANCIKPVNENIILEMRNEVVKSNGMLDFELQIQKTIIHSNAACNDPNHVITNVIVKHKTDDNYKTKENNTLSKPIHTHKPRKENVVNSNTEEKELQNSNVEKRSDNKEDSVPQSKCVVNQKELNVNTNKNTQEGEKNKNITTKKVFDKQGINSSNNNDSHKRDIPIETSINHNVPDKETLDSKLVDNPGPSKTIKVEQDSLIGNSNVKIKEEVLDDDTDDEKLVIAEFTDLITDKSVTLEVKAEPQEIFENDMINWGRNDTDNENVDVDNDRENSGEYITWTPHLGAVRGGVNMEEESDDEDLPLMNIKKKKKKMYSCKRCKFNGHHVEYQEHRKMCVRQKKYRKRFYPENCDKYECTICEKQFGALIKYLKHLTTHGYQWLQCPECMDNFLTRARLSQHVLHHINKNYVPLRGITSAKDYGFKMQCTQCDDEVQPHNFFSHWERHLASARRLQRKPPLAIEDCAPHSPMLRDLIAILLDRYTVRDDDEHKPLRWCKMCERPFTRDNECKRHYVEHLLDDAFSHMTDTQGLRCQICGEMWEKCSDFRLHIRAHASMPVYRCELCSKTFSDSSNFAKHRKVHNLCAFTCDKCGKKFNRKISLIEHIKFHEKTQPISCEFEGCSKVSHTQSAYTKHLKLVHYRSKYRCQICKKTLGSNKEMWDHKWQEHRLRKVIADCPICHMQFRKYLDVKAHVRSVHADCLPDLKKLNKLSPEEKIGNVARLVHDVILDPERLNKLSPEEKMGNVAQLVHDVILDPEPEENIMKIEIEDI
ncbi:uncharacterized protein LOC121736536 [Aricia agestis]|uniref:uncharacterized protein LOC121736536 n=1 Tax=Aricia agestis TaxID=91739 RepID=UPI001C20B71B|nr:uncharacterized protein LOC121736536 [Aricia agestis]